MSQFRFGIDHDATPVTGGRVTARTRHTRRRRAPTGGAARKGWFTVLRTYAGWFRLVAIAEACSWAGLLIAMAFKYGLGMPTGVTVLGWVHGLVFTGYVVTCLVVFSPLRWSFPVLVASLVSSIPPLASVAFERWASRRGLLTWRDSAEPTFWGRVAHVLRTLN